MSDQAQSVPRSTPGAAGTVFALSLACFVVMIDSTVVQVMLPSLMDALDASLDEVLWVVNGFTLVYGTMLLPGARLGDMFGSRRLLVTGLLVFLAGSVLCGLAPSVLVLVAGRVVQAIGGAFLIPQTLSLLTVAVPEHRRGAAFGFVSASMALAAIVGPVLGGLLVSYGGWRSAFLVNIPTCALALVVVLRSVPSRSPRKAHELDLLGVALLMAGLGAVTYGLIAGNKHDWGTIVGPITVSGLSAVGITLLAVLVWWERRRSEPLVSLELFRFKAFSLAIWLGILQFALMFGIMLIVTLKVQNSLGGTAFQTGLVFLPMALAAGVASPIAGHATDRWGGRPVITAGLLAMGGGVVWMALIAPIAVTGSSLLGPLAVVGLGVGLIMAPVSAEAVGGLPSELVNTGSGLLATSRQLASALGVAVVGAMLQTTSAGDRSASVDTASFIGAERAALAVLGVFAAAAVISAQFLPRRRGGGRAGPEPAVPDRVAGDR